MEPDEDSLKNALETLNSFFKLSGLRISLSKTKAIWFGAGSKNTHCLCPNYKLDWDTKFRLLGVDFDNNLEGMDSNYDMKINEIKKVFNCWMNRYLTIYGKAVIIKTLALPKLTHLALVLPNLQSKKLKELENLIFSFLWDNKPDKVCRDDAKLAEKAGGLGILDIHSFWKSLKFSWLRRLCNTDAFWPNILCLSVEPILGYRPMVNELLQFGPNLLNNIGKKLSNIFWKQVLCSVTPFMLGALFCYPEKLFMSPLWDNPSITRNNKALEKNMFPTISRKIKTISEFYKPGTNILYSKAEFEILHDINISHDDFLELHFIIKTAYRSLGIQDNHLIATFLPA